MALVLTDINIGAAPNDGTGSPARTAFGYINANNALIEAAINGFGTRVADATGVAAADSAAISAAFAAAGTGGVVIFPADQTYVVSGHPGSTSVHPAVINGNGSVIQLRNEVATTVTGGPYSAGATSITVTSATGLAIGDYIAFSNGSTVICNLTQISNIVGNTLTVGALAFDAGSTLSAGAYAVASDICLFLQVGSGSPSIEIQGLVFDGNSSNRTTGRTYVASSLLKANDITAGVSDAALSVHNCVFRNGPCDGITLNSFPNVRITDNLFVNIFGSGVHPGSTTYGKNYVVSNNVLDNVYQARSGSAPTPAGFGHTSGAGPLVTSIGPTKMVISNNAIDTSTGWGIDAVLNSSTTDFVISGNVISHCNRGGARVQADGERAIISNNEIRECGINAWKISGISTHATTPVITVYSGHTLKNGDTVTISGVSTGTFTGGYAAINTTHTVASVTATTFTVSGVACTVAATDGQADGNDVAASKAYGLWINTASACKVIVSNNLFYESVANITGDSSEINITGNMFYVNTVAFISGKYEAIIFISNASAGNDSVSISGNQFYTMRTSAAIAALGDNVISHIYTYTAANMSITGNTFVGGRFGIYKAASSSVYNMLIANNSFLDILNGTGGNNATCIFIHNGTDCYGLLISGNTFLRRTQTTGGWFALRMENFTNQKGILVTGNAITCNVDPTSGQVGFDLNGGGTGVTVTNNTFAMNGSSRSAIDCAAYTSAAVVKDNIRLGTETLALGSALTTVEQNRQSITAAAAINLNSEYVTLTETVGGYAITLAAPSTNQGGQTKVINMIASAAGNVTLALTNVIGGSAATTATFNAVNESLVLVATGTKWVVVAEAGVTLT